MSFVAEIQANIDDFQRNLDRARAQMDVFADTVGKRIANLGSKFQMIGGAISIGVTAPMIAAGTAAFNMAADFEDALGATDQIFKEASESTKQWADDLPTYFGIAKKEALEYSNMMGSMLVNIGNLTEQEASKQSAKLIELAGDLTAMYGGTTQDAVRALTGALKGNTTMLDNYGMAANDALVKAKALSMGLVEQGKEMSLAAKQTATLALIYEQSAAAQGQASREANGASGSMRAFRTEITNLTTELGSVLLPIITPLIGRLKDMAAGFRSLSPETQKMIVYIGGAVAALGPFLIALGSVMKLAPLVGTAFATMTGPIGIAVAAVAGAAILIVKNWDSIKAYFTTGNGSKTWDSIKKSATSLWNSLTRIFNKIKDVVTAVWEKIGSNVTAIWASAFGIVVNIVEGAFATIANVLQIFASLLKGDFKGALEGVQNLFTTVFSTIQKIALNAISGISSYIAGFLNLIGAESLGASLQGWANGLKPVKTETQEVVKAVEASNTALTSKKGNLNAVTTELGKTAKATKDYARELTEALASMGYYDAALSSIGYKYRNLSKLAKQAGADVMTLGRIAREELGEKLALALGQYDLSKYLKTEESLKSDIKINPTISFDIDGITQKMKEQAKVIASNVKGLVVDALTIDIGSILGDIGASAMESLGQALANGANFVDVLGKGLLSSLGSLAVNVGKQMMAFGAAALGLQKLLTNPYLAIAAGAALVALGSLASASVSKTISSGTSGGGSSYSSSVNNQDYSQFRGALYNNDKQAVELTIKGNNLVGAININQNRNKRLG